MKSITPKLCASCGKELRQRPKEPNRDFCIRKYCDIHCSGAAKRKPHTTKSARSRRSEYASLKEKKQYRPVYEEDSITQADIDQAKLNIEIDQRSNIHFEFRHIKPGDPEFEELCKKITPLEKIRKANRDIGIWSEIDQTFTRRRNENEHDLRG